MASEIINLNDATPAAPAGAVNVKWQKGASSGTDPSSGLPIYPASANVPVFAGDTGAGASAGLVPAAAAGDAAAGKILYAEGAFDFKPLVIGFGTQSGTAGLNVCGTAAAPHAGVLRECLITIDKSDPSVPLEIRINKNGVDIFLTDPTVAAGVPPGTQSTVTVLTSVPLSVSKNDRFSIDILNGTSNWAFTAQLR